MNPGPASGGGRRRDARSVGQALLLSLASTLLLAFTAVLLTGAAPASAAECPNEALRVGPSAGLPECRAYELVSAADPNATAAIPMQASADGDHYAYGTLVPVPGSRSGGTSYFSASRLPGGTWAQVPLGPGAPSPGERDRGSGAPPFLFSSDFSSAAIREPGDIDPDDANQDLPNSWDTYLEDVPSAAFTWLSRDPEVVGPQSAYQFSRPVYLSPDGRRILFDSQRRLLPEDAAPPGTSSLYEWYEGHLELVALVPAAGASCEDDGTPGCVAAATNITGFSSGLGSLPTGSDNISTDADAVSSDGSRIVFEASKRPGESSLRLFVRIDGERTVEASAGAPDVSPPVTEPGAVEYAGADAQDERIFFTSASSLTSDSHLPIGSPTSGHCIEIGACDLYLYQVGSGTLTDLTPFAGPAGGAVERVYDVSEDGRRAYFTSTKALAGSAAEGAHNLYLWEDDGTPRGRLTFIAPIDPGELTEGSHPSEESPLIGMNQPQANRQTAASPDGSQLAFRDRLPIVSGRQTGGFAQVFVYEADSGALSCVSCPGDGSAPSGGASLPPALPDAEDFSDGVGTGELVAIGGGTTTSPQIEPHAANVSAAGALFFQTATSLVPGDTDGTEDVYKWNHGALNLISGGTYPGNSIFAGASVDGSNVFFVSGASLLPGAEAGIPHVYDARVNGGSAPTATSLPCEASACRTPGPNGEASPAPTSPGFHGPGNRRHRRHHRRRHHHRPRHRTNHHHRQEKKSASADPRGRR